MTEEPTATDLSRKTFIGSGVAQTNRDGTSVDMQAATPTNSARRARKGSIHETKLETVTEGKPLFVSQPSQLDVGSEEESEDEDSIQMGTSRPSELDLSSEKESADEDSIQNGTAADSMVGKDSSEGTKTKGRRMVTDSAEMIPRSPSNPQIMITQKEMIKSSSLVENEARADRGRQGGPDTMRLESVLEEHHIIDAIKCGDKSAVERWLDEEGTKVNECIDGRASHGHFFVGDGTALHWAAYHGQLEITRLLLDRGADLYVKARGGETVLHWACQSKEKNERLVDELLRTGGQHPNPLTNFPDNKGWTPLHYACYDNNIKLVLQLIKVGADPNARNYNNCTPLHLVNEDSNEILNLLDPNHLLPRMNDPVLQEYVIELIQKPEVELFQKWLDRTKGVVNRYRGGFTINDGLVLEGGTALHWAAYYGQRAIVDVLIEKGADIRVLNCNKESVLHWACKSQTKDEELIKIIVEKGVCVNFADVDGYTALHYACLRQNHKIADQLLQAGADTTAQTLYGETPLGTAFRTDNKELIELLDKEEHLLPQDDNPILETCFLEAISDDNKKAEVEKWLETTEVEDINCKRGGNHASNDFEVKDGTALHWAAYYGKVEIVKKCLERGANPKVMDKNGETVLHWACKSKTENCEIVELLLKKTSGGVKRCQVDSVDPDEQGHQKMVIQLKEAKSGASARIGGKSTKVQVDSTNSEGYTALHYACWQGHQKVAQLLKDAEADPRARSIKGYTPLDFAVVRKKWELARILDDRHFLPRAGHPRLEKCIIEGGYMGSVQKWLKSQCNNVDHCRDREEGGTALHWAAYHGQLDIVKMLIEKGANPRARAYDNGTVLHWACRSEKGNRELVRLLLKKQCKLDDRDKYGYTPFHSAALHGCQGVVEELLQWDRLKAVVNYRVLESKAVFKAKESEGHTPLVKASLRGYHGVVKLLLKRGAKVEPQDLRSAIEKGNEHVVSDLLQSPQWPTLLHQSWEETTPFRELIKKMPDVAKQVLNRCVASTPEKVELDYSFVEDHTNEDASSTKGFKKSKHPLNIMVQHGRLEMLTHPVISSLLQHKWFHFGLWLYLLNLFIYIIYLGFLTAFALLVVPPQSNTCLQVPSSPGIAVCENGAERGEYTAETEMMVNDTTSEGNVTCFTCELRGTTSFLLITSAVIVNIFASIRLFMEVFQFGYDPKSYISDWTNLLEVSLYVLSIIFAWTSHMCPEKWQWQVGVMAVLLAWIYLIRFCAKFPSTGIYIIMFGKIFITFLNVIILSMLLLTTFAITFHMTFSEAQFQRSPFFSLSNTMLKITSMTAGDFSFDTVFRQSPSGESEDAKEIQFPLISIFLWITFVIVMPILFINLLIGLAVGDTSEIQEKARLTRLALQVDMILTAEHLLHVLHVHKCFSTKPSPVILTPNKMERLSFNELAMKYAKHIIYYISGGDHYDAATLHEALKCCLQDSESEEQKEMSYEREQMAEYVKKHTVDVTQKMEQMAEYVKEYTMEAKQKQNKALEKAEKRMQSTEQMMEERMQSVKQHMESVEQRMRRRMESVEEKMEKHMQSMRKMMEEHMKSVKHLFGEAAQQQNGVFNDKWQ